MNVRELKRLATYLFEGALRDAGHYPPPLRLLHDDYIGFALLNPFVQAQIQLGIYDADTFPQEFLGAARVVYNVASERMQIEYDPLLMAYHLDGLDLTEMFGYTEVTAVHEIVHLRQGLLSDSTAVEHERLCNEYVREIVGQETYRTYERALTNSPTISRVLKRIASLNKAH